MLISQVFIAKIMYFHLKASFFIAFYCSAGPCLERGGIFLPGGKCGCHHTLPHYHNLTNRCYPLGKFLLTKNLNIELFLTYYNSIKESEKFISINKTIRIEKTLLFDFTLSLNSSILCKFYYVQWIPHMILEI